MEASIEATRYSEHEPSMEQVGEASKVIFDKAHYYKNPDTNITRFLKSLNTTFINSGPEGTSGL